MIDTSKYEGHPPGPWRVDKTSGIVTEAGMPVTALTNQRLQTMALMADAPLLLEEVKRLREVAYNKDMQVGESDREVKRLREALRIERRIVQAFYDYRDARCYEDCETWMLEKGHRVMVKYGDEEQSEWKVEVE